MRLIRSKTAKLTYSDTEWRQSYDDQLGHSLVPISEIRSDTPAGLTFTLPKFVRTRAITFFHSPGTFFMSPDASSIVEEGYSTKLVSEIGAFARTGHQKTMRVYVYGDTVIVKDKVELDTVFARQELFFVLLLICLVSLFVFASIWVTYSRDLPSIPKFAFAGVSSGLFLAYLGFSKESPIGSVFDWLIKSLSNRFFSSFVIVLGLIAFFYNFVFAYNATEKYLFQKSLKGFYDVANGIEPNDEDFDRYLVFKQKWRERPEVWSILASRYGHLSSDVSLRTEAVARALGIDRTSRFAPLDQSLVEDQFMRVQKNCGSRRIGILLPRFPSWGGGVKPPNNNGCKYAFDAFSQAFNTLPDADLEEFDRLYETLLMTVYPDYSKIVSAGAQMDGYYENLNDADIPDQILNLTKDLVTDLRYKDPIEQIRGFLTLPINTTIFGCVDSTSATLRKQYRSTAFELIAIFLELVYKDEQSSSLRHRTYAGPRKVFFYVWLFNDNMSGELKNKYDRCLGSNDEFEKEFKKVRGVSASGYLKMLKKENAYGSFTLELNRNNREDWLNKILSLGDELWGY